MDTPIITALTSMPRTELVARYGGGIAGGVIIGIGLGYAMARGWYVPDKDQLALGGQILGGLVLSTVATKLGLTSLAKSEQTVVANTVHAALTGEISEAVAAKVTPDQAAAIEASPIATVAPVKPA